MDNKQFVETFLRWFEQYGGSQNDAKDPIVQAELNLFYSNTISLIPGLYGALIQRDGDTVKGPNMLLAAFAETLREMSREELKKINQINGEPNEDIIKDDYRLKLAQ